MYSISGTGKPVGRPLTRAESRVQCIIVLLRRNGIVPFEMSERLYKITDSTLLDNLLIEAAETKSIPEYRKYLEKLGIM